MHYSRALTYLLPCLAIGSFFGVSSANGQVYSSSPQGTPQSSPQSAGFSPCICPFPQGKCNFPQGFDALPVSNCGTPMSSPQMSSPQSSYPSIPMYVYPKYSPKSYPSPVLFIPKPLGIPAASMPTPQSTVLPTAQEVPAKE